ncbi:MAG: DUF1667 domain-containing protein [Oscillospiraceae bacterium]|nr:DUF1667 domain-containing protein [Oscillospiraceae bacterium]
MKELICISCPAGCRLEAEALENGEIRVSGNSCKRGLDFAMAEMTRPMRSLCSTVRTAFGDFPMLPVRTDREIPKSAIPEAMKLISGIVVEERIACGDVVSSLAPICEGNLIATSSGLISF